MKKVYVFLLILVLINLTFGFSSKVFASDYINVILSPNIANTQNAITIQLRFDNVDIVSGTRFEVGFDEASDQSTKINIPTSVFPSYMKLQYESTTLTSSAASVSSIYYPGGYAYRLGLVAPTGTNIPRGTNFSIIIDKDANIYPKITGSHSLFVVVGSTNLPANYTVGTSSTSQSITISSIAIDNPELSQASTYTFVFTPGVNIVTGDKITVQFPTGFKVPTTIDGSNFALKQGNSVISTFSGKVSVSGNSVTLTIPSTQYTFYAGYATTLMFGAFTGIYNPKTAGDYTFYMYTSKQTALASYTISIGTRVASLSVQISPLSENAVGNYIIRFYTSANGALAKGDTIIILFPDKFTVPSSIIPGSVFVNNTIAKVDTSGSSLIITLPISIGNSSLVTVHITADAKMKNPPVSATGYKIKVYTSKDQYPINSSKIMFTSSTVRNVKVTVSPAVVRKSASYSVDFTLGPGGALSSGDVIYIIFPLGTVLPSQISVNNVSIKIVNSSEAYTPESISISSSTRTVSITLPQGVSIDANSEILLSFNEKANITNSVSNGFFKLKVSTSKETSPIGSGAFEIFSNPVSTISVTPAAPDGSSGYYITQPSFTLSVKKISGATVTAYYKIGKNGTYKTYNLNTKPAIEIPEGKTTVYYYTVDNFGDKEPVHSKAFMVDLTNPVITITSPQENSVIVQPTFDLKGVISALDIDKVNLLLDGKPVQVAKNGSFETLVSVPKEAVNTFVLKVISASRRSATKQFSIDYIQRVTIFLQVGNDNAYINSEQVKISALPFISNGSVMVPLRFVVSSFKTQLDWDPIFQIVTLTLGSSRMRVQIGNLRADVNGQLKVLPTPPVLVKGVTFVPLRFISENFGASVTWDGTLKAVSIVYPKP